MKLSNTMLSDDKFFEEQKEVLGQWKTGAKVNFDESVAYQKSIPDEKRFGVKLAKAKKEGITLLQPRAGVAIEDEHVQRLQ